MQSFDLTATRIPTPPRLACAVIAIALTQILVGCSNSDKVANKAQSSKADQNTQVIDCSSPNVVAVLQQTTLNQISQQVTTNVQQLAGQAGIATNHLNLTNMLSQLNIAVTNPSAIAGQTDQCQATIAVTLPENIITKANQIATSLNQPAIAQNLATKGLNLENNTITAINAGFKLTPSGATYQANLSNGSSTSSVLVTEVGNLLANAQLAQLIGTADNTPTLQAASTTTTTVITNNPTRGSTANTASNLSPADNTNSSNPPVIVTRTQTSEPHNTASSTVQPAKTTTHTTVTKKVEKPENKENEPKKVVKTITTIKNVPDEKPVTETPKAETNAVTKKPTSTNKLEPATEMGPAAKPKPAAKTASDDNAVTKKPTSTNKLGPAAKPKPVAKTASDNEVKLTIEEKNEKY